jgi:hypothetical protein
MAPESVLAASTRLGCIPFPLRVAVTGHRHLDSPERLAARVVAALDHIASGAFASDRDTPTTFVALSAIAEGADRIVAEAVLATEGGTLEVELPLARDDYAKDFPTESSRRQFYDLLAAATSVSEPEDELADAELLHHTESREAKYERAGRAIVDKCDVLLAVWDGNPAAGRGGTADIVAYALGRRVPVVAIPAGGGPLEIDLGETDDAPVGIFSVCGVDRTRFESSAKRKGFRSRERGNKHTNQNENHNKNKKKKKRKGIDDERRPYELTRETQKELERYNRTAHSLRHLRDSPWPWTASHEGAEPPERFEKAIAFERNKLPVADLKSLGLEDLTAWILPYFVRADRTARAYQRWYYALVTFEFVAAALAVLIVAAVSQLWKTQAEQNLIGIEMFLLVLVVGVVLLGRHRGLNRRWLTSRFLAERFRSALFLKAAGLGAWTEPEARVSGEGDPAEAWIERAHGFVWSAQPRVEVQASQIAPSRDVLVSTWIDERERGFAWVSRPQVEGQESRAASIRDFLVSSWIDPQIDYHRGQAESHHRRGRRLTFLSVGLFILTFLVAAAHLANADLSNHVRDDALEELVVAASIALPAFGSAVAGIGAHRQYQRSSTVHRSMARQLRRLQDRMARAQRLPDIQRLATEAASTMVKETRDWLGVMRFSDFEISA